VSSPDLLEPLGDTDTTFVGEEADLSVGEPDNGGVEGDLRGVETFLGDGEADFGEEVAFFRGAELEPIWKIARSVPLLVSGVPAHDDCSQGSKLCTTCPPELEAADFKQYLTPSSFITGETYMILIGLLNSKGSSDGLGGMSTSEKLGLDLGVGVLQTVTDSKACGFVEDERNLP
jgi:hypothetical protein